MRQISHKQLIAIYKSAWETILKFYFYFCVLMTFNKTLIRRHNTSIFMILFVLQTTRTGALTVVAGIQIHSRHPRVHHIIPRKSWESLGEWLMLWPGLLVGVSPWYVHILLNTVSGGVQRLLSSTLVHQRWKLEFELHEEEWFGYHCYVEGCC